MDQLLFVCFESDLSHLRNDTAYSETIGTNCQILVLEHVFQFQTIYNRKDPLQQRHRDLEADKIVILAWRITILGDL